MNKGPMAPRPVGPVLIDNTGLRAKRRRKKRIRMILGLLFFLAALLLIIFKDDIDFAEIRLLLTGQSTAFASAVHEGTVLDIVFDMSGNSVAESYKKNLVLANSRKVAVHRPDGTLASEFTVAMQNPCILAGKRYFLVYDRGGNSLYVANSISKVLKITTDFPIITASINDKGEFAYVTGSKIYKTELYVYNSSMHLAYEWYSQSAYINHIVMAPKGDRVAMAGITTEETDFVTSLKVLDIGKELVEDEQLFRDELLLKALWDGDRLTAMTDRGIYRYNSDTKVMESATPFTANELAFLETDADGRGVLIFNDFVQGKGGQMEIYDGEAKHVASVSLAKTPNKVVMNNGKIVVLYANSAEIYSKNGVLLKAVPEQIFRTACINDAENVYFVGMETISVYS